MPNLCNIQYIIYKKFVSSIQLFTFTIPDGRSLFSLISKQRLYRLFFITSLFLLSLELLIVWNYLDGPWVPFLLFVSFPECKSHGSRVLIGLGHVCVTHTCIRSPVRCSVYVCWINEWIFKFENDQLNRFQAHS